MEILKSDDTVTDWVEFWEQFEEEIDRCKQDAVTTKFFYLGELLSNQQKTEDH